VTIDDASPGSRDITPDCHTKRKSLASCFTYVGQLRHFSANESARMCKKNSKPFGVEELVAMPLHVGFLRACTWRSCGEAKEQAMSTPQPTFK
jgi:hypothetical protein